MKHFLLLFILVALPQMLAADSQSPLDFTIANVLYAACTSTNATYQIACRSYIEGVADGFHTTAEAYQSVNVPDAVTFKQIHDVAINYLTQHPEKRHLRSAALIVQALREAWPAN